MVGRLKVNIVTEFHHRTPFTIPIICLEKNEKQMGGGIWVPSCFIIFCNKARDRQTDLPERDLFLQLLPTSGKELSESEFSESISQNKLFASQGPQQKEWVKTGQTDSWRMGHQTATIANWNLHVQRHYTFQYQEPDIGEGCCLDLLLCELLRDIYTSYFCPVFLPKKDIPFKKQDAGLNEARKVIAIGVQKEPQQANTFLGFTWAALLKQFQILESSPWRQWYIFPLNSLSWVHWEELWLSGISEGPGFSRVPSKQS